MTGYVAAGLCVISGWGNGFVERQASKSEKVKKVSPGTGLVRLLQVIEKGRRLSVFRIQVVENGRHLSVFRI